MAEILATASDDVAFSPVVHVTLAFVGAGNMALGTLAAIKAPEGHSRLPGPIIAGVTGLPLLVMSIYNLVSDRRKPDPIGGMLRCIGYHCRAGVPLPLFLSDPRGALVPGLRLVDAHF